MDFEFKSKRLSRCMSRLEIESQFLIDAIIAERSPIQVGENVETICGSVSQTLRVVSVTLHAVDSWSYPGDRLSFVYEGLPLTKKGVPMRGRKPIEFNTFFKNGKRYSMPSYNRVEIKSARMHYEG